MATVISRSASTSMLAYAVHNRARRVQSKEQCKRTFRSPLTREDASCKSSKAVARSAVSGLS